MKRLIPTIVLVILCIGGFWYASSKDFFKEKKAETPSLVTVKKEEAASYTIKNGDSVIELQQKDGKWSMTKPSAIPVDDSSAAGWVSVFSGVTKDKSVDTNPKDLAQFGLDKPKQEFAVTTTGGTTYTLSIGDPVAVQGFYYAKFSSSPEVFQISESNVTGLGKQQLDFMDKSPIKFDYEKLSSLMVDWKGTKWTLTKSDKSKKSYESDWKLGDQTVKGADASNYLDKALFMSTEQLAKKASDVKGLDAPELKIEIKETDTAGKETTSTYAGKVDGDNVWIAKQGDAWAYAIPSATIQELSDVVKPKPADTTVPAPGAASPAPASPAPAPAGAAK